MPIGEQEFTQIQKELMINSNKVMRETIGTIFTKREAFAISALMGMLSHKDSTGVPVEGLIKTSYMIADLMIKEGKENGD